jgi:hypothetical protein
MTSDAEPERFCCSSCEILLGSGDENESPLCDGIKEDGGFW